MEANLPLLDTTGVGDLVLLDPLSEESLLQNLKERFGHQEIYVGVGGCAGGGAMGPIGAPPRPRSLETELLGYRPTGKDWCPPGPGPVPYGRGG